MLKKIFKRLLTSFLTLFAIISVSFFMMKFAPGGPFDDEKRPPPAVKKIIEEKYHLDKPLWKQYAYYMWDLMHFDLGPSFRVAHLRVNDVMVAGMGNTLKLGLGSMCFALCLGLAIGLVAAFYKDSWIDNLVMSSVMVGVSVPTMVLAPLLLMIFALSLKWLPNSGLVGWKSYILPIFSLGLYYAANIARLTRGSMLEVLNSQYVLTAYSKGLPGKYVVLLHCVRPTLLPVLSYMGPATAGMLAGSLIVEKIFVIPGIGRQFVDSAFARDYPMALGMILFYCFMVIVFNAVVDILYQVLDPRIGESEGGR